MALVALGVSATRRTLSPGGRLGVNLVAAAASTAAARAAGVEWSELGLTRAAVGPGLRWGAAAGALLAAGVLAAARVPRIGDHFTDERIGDHQPRRAAFELTVRIPLETALAEELIFRSALLGIARGSRSTPAAVATSSVMFGLWHVIPTWTALDGSAVGAAAGARRSARLGSVAAVVVATTGAGAAFALIRLRSGSVLAPVLAHASLNAASFVATRRTHQRLRNRDPQSERNRS